MKNNRLYIYWEHNAMKDASVLDRMPIKSSYRRKRVSFILEDRMKYNGLTRRARQAVKATVQKAQTIIDSFKCGSEESALAVINKRRIKDIDSAVYVNSFGLQVQLIRHGKAVHKLVQ